MATEESKSKNIAYKNKWISENKERINLIVEKGQKDKIKAHAEHHKESLNGFINRAIDETMCRDALPPPESAEDEQDAMQDLALDDR